MMDSNILISICCDHCFLGIKTYSRENGRNGRFLLRRELIEKLLSDDPTTEVVDMDGSNYATVRISEYGVFFQICWLCEYSNQTLKGLRQSFTLPRSAIEGLLESDIITKSFLYQPPARSAKVDHAGAARTIRNILPDKRKRRALSKAMRDAFQWPGEQVVLHYDGGCNFFFTTERAFAICGGLILHEGTKNGYPCVYFSVHT